MAFEFKLPDIGEGIHEGEIAKWLVAEGDKIKEDDVLVEIQNDKAVVEIPSPVDGTISKLHIGEGEVTTVGTTIVTIDDGSEESAEETPDDSNQEESKETAEKPVDDASKPADEEKASETSPNKEKKQADDKKADSNEFVIAMPSVRKFARENDINIKEVTGS